MRQRTVRRAALLALGAMIAAGCTKASDKQQNSLNPKGKAARDILNLFTPFFWIAVVVGVGVIGATVYLAIRYRERPGNENPRQVHGNTVLEVSWTIVPAVIMAVMAAFTVALIWQQAAKPAGALEVNVTGKQWWWEFEYTNNGRRVFTANELHIPAGRPVYFRIRSDNVAHSFWIPNLNGKKDAIPGRVNTNWVVADANQAGKVFYGACTEYCGDSHADMRNKVFVDSPATFQRWYQSQLRSWTAAQVKTFSQWNKVYGCSACHYIKGLDPVRDAAIEQGKATPIAEGPNLTQLATRSTFAAVKYELNRENLWRWIYDAPAHRAGDFGKFNECPKRGAGGATGPGTPCKVGMPSFRDDPVAPMSEQTAKNIADFLLGINKP